MLLLLAGCAAWPAVARAQDGATGAQQSNETTITLADGELLPITPESPPATVIVLQMDVAGVFAKIRDQTGVRITPLGAVIGAKIDLQERDTPVEQILSKIAQEHGWKWVGLQNGEYEVMDMETYKTRYLREQVQRVPFHLKYVDAEELNGIIQPLLTPEIGSSAADARTNNLIVTDLPPRIALIESIIREYDIQLYARIFEVQNAKVNDIADRLNDIKSSSAELQVDPLNRVIIAKDTFEKIKLMEQLVEILDRDQEMWIYHLNNIGSAGDYAQQLIDNFIQPLVTEDGILQFNPVTNRLLVRDIRPVHEKILDVLDKLDTPKKQVLIEGEVLSVLLNHQLNWGLQSSFSNNLSGAIGAGQGGIAGFNGEAGGFDPTGLPLTAIGATGINVIQLTENIKAELNAALSDSRTDLLLRPRLIITDNEQGSFSVEKNDPILTTYYSNDINNNIQSSGQAQVTSGLTIDITPHISNRGLVELEIHFENSTSEDVGDIGQGIRGIRTQGDFVDTIMLIPSGDTRVIGGLLSENKSDDTSGVPYLSKIPVLGFLFGSRKNINNKRNLMFFLTPTIIEELPKNDLVAEPVNAEARRRVEEIEQAAATPESVNPIPPELLPYLRQLRRPEIPLDGAAGTTGTLPASETTTTTMPTVQIRDGVTTSTGALLTNEPYIPPGAAQRLRTGGAAVPLRGMLAGPSGTFGGTMRPIGRPSVAATATTETTTVLPTAEQPGAAQAQPTPTPPATPTPTPPPQPTPGPTPRTETVNR